MNIAFKAHELIGCRGVTRSDFKYFKEILPTRNKYTTRYDKLIISA